MYELHIMSKHELNILFVLFSMLLNKLIFPFLGENFDALWLIIHLSIKSAPLILLS